MAHECTYTGINELANIIMTFDKNFFEYVRKTYECRHSPEHRHAFADMYWRMFLAGMSALIVLCFLYAAWQLGSVLYSLDTTTVDVPHGASSLINRTQLQNTIQQFQTRTTKFNSFKTSPSIPVVDPS